jgi:hypothetical protein
MDSLSSLEGLSDLRLRGGVDMRPTLLRVLTDLYVQKIAHTPDEERHYTELALRLLDAVDVATRTAVAVRLARHLAPPRRIIERLAADLPDVAGPLRGHRLLQKPGAGAVHDPIPAAVVAMQRAATAEAAQASAAEQPAAEQLAAVAAAPAEEASAPITPCVIAADIAYELNELFFAANAQERRLILLNLDIVVRLDAATADIRRDGAIAQRLETAALGRDRETFAAALAQTLHIPRQQARRIVDDRLGEPIVTAAKALLIPRDAVYRILLFVNTDVGHSVERVHALATLYDEITVAAAGHMVAIWQAMDEPAAAAKQYRPLLSNDEARLRARTTSAAVRQAPSTQRPNVRRDAS